MGVRCGIDLGTTYSSISWFDSYNNRVETIDLESSDGGRLLRSVVYYPGEGNPPVVGDAAWNAKRNCPDRVIDAIKRSMGTSYKTPPIDGVQYTPQQVSAEILKALVRDAEAFLGEKVTEVVITVPAYFGDAERAATEEAGKLAGLCVLGLLPEPHAAALAFAIDRVAEIVDRKILVYDLGGGTFDVTMIHASTRPDAANALNLHIETLCKEGNRELGGLDWDRALAEMVAERILQAHGVDVWQDPKCEAVLLDNCEKGKRQLTRVSPTSIVGDLDNHQIEVSVAEFEDRTRDLLLQTEMLIQTVLNDGAQLAGCTVEEFKKQIDAMLSGGSSRMPMVKRLLEALMGKPPLQHQNPDLLVTRGAAYWAHLLQGGTVTGVGPDNKPVVVKSAGGLAIVDTSPYAVGVRAVKPLGGDQYEDYNAVVLPKGAKYDQVFDKVFETTEKDMTEIEIALFKGELADLGQCEPLMTCTISGLPSGRPAGRPVKVSLQYDKNGIIRGKAVDLDTSADVSITVDRSKISA